MTSSLLTKALDEVSGLDRLPVSGLGKLLPVPETGLDDPCTKVVRFRLSLCMHNHVDNMHQKVIH